MSKDGIKRDRLVNGNRRRSRAWDVAACEKICDYSECFTRNACQYEDTLPGVQGYAEELHKAMFKEPVDE